MGNKICRISDICGDNQNQNSSFNSRSNGEFNQSYIFGKAPLAKGENPPSDNEQKGNRNVLILPPIKYIDSYNAYNNFYFILNRIVFLQKNIKEFLKRKKNKKSNLLKPNITLLDIPNKRKMSFLFSHSRDQINFTNPIHNNNPNYSLSPKISPVSRFSPKKNFLNNNVNDENESIIVNDNVKGTSISLYSFNISMRSEGALNSSEIKGYFLKKNKKYKYKGHLNNKKKDGFGIVTWLDESVLYANFTNNRANGFCKYIDIKGTTFTGLYVNNRPSGYGIYYKGSQVKYEGEWINNNLNGLGFELWKDDTFYQGNFENSIKKGIGIYRWADGTIYQGEWSNNQMNGFGCIAYTDERSFQGEFVNGAMEGFGEFEWPDKKKYIGNYIKGQKEGFGIFFWSYEPLLVYIGLWQKGKMEGVGIKITEEVLAYGIWKDGERIIDLQGSWEGCKHLKGQSSRYRSFFEKKDQEIINFIKKYF